MRNTAISGDGKLTDTGQKIEVGGGAAAIRASTDR